MSTPNGEPERAFPGLEVTSRGEPYHNHLGMTLRDWFAGRALEGDLAAQNEATGEWLNRSAGLLASRCYLIADAMLAERAKNRTP
jgi:hypothetical protein